LAKIKQALVQAFADMDDELWSNEGMDGSGSTLLQDDDDERDDDARRRKPGAVAAPDSLPTDRAALRARAEAAYAAAMRSLTTCA
jgi:hypothetical protein